MPKRPAAVLATETIATRIHLIRGEKVLLDGDLAAQYGVPTRRLNEQVRRNRGRFPADFIFQLSAAEFLDLKSQFATSSWGGRRKLPLAFTEHGAIMAATVLNAARAVEMSVYVVRAFVRMRELISHNKEIAKQLAALERRVDSQDETIVEIVQSIRQLMATPPRPPEPKRRAIGFVTPKEK